MMLYLSLTGRIILVAQLGLSLACTSSEAMRLGNEPDELPAGPNVHGAAYGADSFNFRKQQRIRKPNDYIFFFKHCSSLDEPNFHSKSSYGCTLP